MSQKYAWFMFLLLLLSATFSVNAYENVLSRNGLPPASVSQPPVPGSPLPYERLPEVNDSEAGPMVVYTNTSATGDYVDHIVTIENANKKDPVWINLFAGPYGTFQKSGKECHPTDCSPDNECCPTVGCTESSCGSTPCTKGTFPLPGNGGFRLDPGSSRDVVVKVVKNKNSLTGAGGITVWARTGCKPSNDPDYPLVCDTANCDLHYAPHSRVECGGVGSQPPSTKAEITFDGDQDMDHYDVSLVDGWNVPMSLRPVSGNYNDHTGNPYVCTCAGGNSDLVPLAEKELPLMIFKNADKTPVGVWSACKYSVLVDPKQQDPAFCCIGTYANPEKCADNVPNWPSEKQTAGFFQKYYPKAYSFAYGDNIGGLFTCKPDDNNPIQYKLTIYGDKNPSSTFEAVTTISTVPGNPVPVRYETPGVGISITASSEGTHEVHLEVLTSAIPPEDPDDYNTSISTMGNIYHILSTIPDSEISDVTFRMTYPEEAYGKAGLKEDSLRLWSYNPDTDIWSIVPGGVDTVKNIISGSPDGWGYFTISGEKTLISEKTIRLSPGWNFVSPSHRLAAGYNTCAIFAGVDTGGHSVLTFNPADGWVGMKKDDILDPLDGVWIYSVTACEVQLHVDTNPVYTPLTKKLSKGWNSIGFSNINPATARDTLLSVRDCWMYCVGYDADLQKYNLPIHNRGTGDFTDSRMMNPGHGYWLYMSCEGTLAGLSVNTE